MITIQFYDRNFADIIENKTRIIIRKDGRNVCAIRFHNSMKNNIGLLEKYIEKKVKPFIESHSETVKFETAPPDGIENWQG